MYVNSSSVASKQKRSKLHHNSGERGFYVADSLEIKMGFIQVSTQARLTVCAGLHLAVLGEHMMQFHLRHSSIDRLRHVNTINLLSVVMCAYNSQHSRS